MRALGMYIVRGYWQAIGVISVLTLLSLLLPPLAYLLSGIPVALVALRRGPVMGLQVIIGAVLLTGLLAWFAKLTVMIAPAFAVGIWLPVLLCSAVLRVTESQGKMVLAAGSLGAAFATLMYVLVEDVPGWWRAWFDKWLKASMPDDTAAQYQELFDSAMPLMNAVMASGLVLSLVLTLLLARSWQSLLFNPGGFRQEFYCLRLPRVLTVAVAAGMALTLLDTGLNQWFFRDLLIILVFMYLFQGVAAVHRIVSQREYSMGWLAGMYVLLLLMPQAALLLACIGIADSWVGEQKPLT